MSNFYCRIIEDRDLDAVKAIWKEVFGDTDAYVDRFFRTFYTPGTGIAAVSGEDVISHFFSLPGAFLSTPEREYAASLLVALATDPRRRGAGAGGETARETARLAFSQGAQLACLMPAEETLFAWYERAIGARTLFYTRERKFTRDALPAPGGGPPPRKISPGEYGALREKLLAGTPHVRFNGRFLDWMEYESRSGGLFTLGNNSCAVVSVESETRILELLCPDGGAFAKNVSALSAYFGARECVVRSPAFWGADETHGKIRPAVVAAARPGLQWPDLAYAYWGFMFD